MGTVGFEHEQNRQEGLREPRVVFPAGMVKRPSDGREYKMEVIEYEPQIRTCKFHIYRKKTRFWLAMPYMQFTRMRSSQGVSLHVSFTNQPIETLEDTVYFPPLPNLWYPSLQCCLMRAKSPSFQDMMSYFWDTEYLDCEDWYSFPVLDKETPMRTLKRWQEMTEKDPSFILDVEWTQPTRIIDFPEEDGGSPKVHCNPSYGGTSTNRHHGIRGFAVANGNAGDGF